jgi:hypothetical protein
MAAIALAVCALIPIGASAATRLPDVVTGKVGKAHGVTVLLTGTIDPQGSPTTYYFQFGPTAAYTSRTATGNAGSGIKPLKVGLSAAPMLLGYHYRLVASNAAGTRLGKDRVYSLPKKSKLKFEVPKGAATLWGHVVVISGRLLGAGAAFHRLALEASPFPYKEAFEEIGAPTITNAAGRFTFRVGVLRTSTQFRVMTLDALPKFSHPFKELITPRVTFSVHTSSRFGFVRLFGQVTPVEVGARVTFQYEKQVRPGVKEKNENRTTKFKSAGMTTVKRATKQFSYYSLILNVKQGGRFRAIVTPRSGGLGAGTSRTIFVHGPTRRSRKKA